jgi:hypothetical protein
MNPATPQPPAWRKVAAPLLLGAVLLQLLSFFFGLMVPLNRVVTLWGRSVDARRAMLTPSGASIKSVADRLPVTARVYLMNPDATTHKNSVYYFCPRIVSITMTDACYEAVYEQWNERPTREWLVTNHYTYLLSYKDKILTPIQP